jgi:hypothetical protein
MISKKAEDVLKAMAAALDAEDYDEAELVVDGRSTWLGYEKVPRRVVIELLEVVAIRDISDGGKLQRYVISGTGRAILEDPETAFRVMSALMRGIPVDERGHPIQTTETPTTTDWDRATRNRRGRTQGPPSRTIIKPKRRSTALADHFGVRAAVAPDLDHFVAADDGVFPDDDGRRTDARTGSHVDALLRDILVVADPVSDHAADGSAHDGSRGVVLGDGHARERADGCASDGADRLVGRTARRRAGCQRGND